MFNFFVGGAKGPMNTGPKSAFTKQMNALAIHDTAGEWVQILRETLLESSGRAFCARHLCDRTINLWLVGGVVEFGIDDQRSQPLTKF